MIYTDKKLVIQSREQYPEYNLRQLAKIHNISSERVRQILKNAGKPTIAYKEPYKYCPHCFKPIYDQHKVFCNRRCYHNFHWKKVKCTNCGTLFPRKVGQINLSERVKRKNNYCSKRCQGQYIGNNFGFKVNPNVAGSDKRRGRSKYRTLVPEIIARNKKGESVHSVLVSKNISGGNTHLIKKMVDEYKQVFTCSLVY